MPVAAPQLNQRPRKTPDVTTRAISGVKVLAARTLISALLRVVSTLVLARLLFPREYGLFGVASSITGLGMFLCDVGLASALVRQETAPTRNAAFTVFCTQQVITGLVAIAIAGAVPALMHIYALPPAAKPLLLTMAFGLFSSSLRIVPMLALERDLQFPIIARCELLENLAQTGSTIAFAYSGWGAWALAGGGLVRGVVGLVLVWSASPWRPAGQFEWHILKRLARFGFAFQLSSVIPALLGGWMPLVVGRLLGVAAVGLVGWAVNLASVPLMLSAVLNRVAFPAYSRLSSDPDALGSSLSLSIRRLSAVFSLLIPLVVLVCPLSISLLFQARWSPAIPLVQWFSVECAVLTLTGLLASAQNAMGYAGERLVVTVIIGGLRCSIGYCAVRHFGLLGIGPAVFLVSLTELGASAHLVKLRNPVCGRLLRETLQPLLTAGAMLAAGLVCGRVVYPHDILGQTTVSLAVFVGLIAAREAVTGGRALGTELRAIHRMLRPVRRESQCLST